MDSSNEFNDDYSSASESFSLSLQKDNESTYNGILSLPENSISKANNRKREKKEKTNKTNNNNKIAPITFEWDKEESDVVYLTGDFCNWKQFLIMPKNNKNIYSLTIPLPRGRHQFKFRINNIYQLNHKYPVMKDGENENNYIDTSKPANEAEAQGVKDNDEDKNDNEDDSEDNDDEDESEEDEEEEGEEEESEEEEEEEEDESEKMRKKKEEIRNNLKKMEYNTQFPKRGIFSSMAPDLPYIYNYELNLDLFSNQGKIGRKKYIEPKENDILGDNYSHKKINVLPFVETNHAHSKINSRCALCSIFFRYRNKFSTFIYYKKNNDAP